MSRKILTVVELENYPENVVARATWLAKLHDAGLELLLSEPASGFLTDTFILSEEVQRIAEDIDKAEDVILAQLAKAASDEGVDTSTSKVSSRGLTDSIVDRAESMDALFVLKGTHYHTPAERASFADTDWQLMRRLECPLWFVKPGSFAEKPVIVAAIDPTHAADEPGALDKRIVETTMDLVRRCGGRASIVHTFQRLTEIGTLAMKSFKPMKLPLDELDAKIRDEHRRKVEAFAGEHGIPKDTLHVLPGRAHEILPSFARTEGASLVVMGAISRRGADRGVIGNTAERTLDHLPCDVLIIHPADT